MRRRSFVAAALAALFAAGEVLAAPARKKSSGRGASKPGGRRKKRAEKPARQETTSTAPAANPPARVVAEAPEAREPTVPWRTYDVQTSFALADNRAPLRLWLPLPIDDEVGFQRVVDHSWEGNADRVGFYSEPENDLAVLFAEWREGAPAPKLKFNYRVATRDRQFDITQRSAPPERPEILRRYLRSTPYLPTDGVVRNTAERILGRIKDPVAQAKALYDWVVDKTRFDTGASPGIARLRDVSLLIDESTTPARCADINGLFVALARSVGIPARLTLGLRVDQSQIVASLGQRGELAQAQHCRAAFYAPGYGWIPVDPADVRKALGENGDVLDAMKTSVLRKLLFGYWEMNWVALNRAQDVSLRQAQASPLPFFAGPYLEAGGIAAGETLARGLSIVVKRGVDS